MSFAAKLEQVRISAPEGVRPAAQAMRTLANELFPCRVAACHNIAVKHTMCDNEGAILATSVFGWTDEDRWWRTPQLALASPLPTACRYEAEPFWANAEGIRTRRPNTWVQTIDLSDFERRACARAAIVAPVHLPFGQIGAVSFNPLDEVTTDLSREFELYSDELGLLSLAFIASYQRVMVKAMQLPGGDGVILSKREVECLRWAAIGKTDQEIAMIMSRSRATVRFHIHNAGLKLNAVNRSQTVFKAAQLGYISPAA
jgi:DNA-binding CsgD family transcriptional regulator